MGTEDEEEEDQIRTLLREETEDRDAITEDLVLEIYNLEDELSTLDRRHGIQDGIQSILENYADENDAS
ncbi:hypothetical protein [Halovenus sp. HT40]|uniref:hypothetical protein n=1 Tax=Halovenus sp. HT40 TaxID=3126691 RepID=UPI00300E7833